MTLGRLTAVLSAMLVGAICAAPASASRRATGAETRGMWRTVDPGQKCVHHRGVVSTVKSARYRYGRVTVADSNCGDGVVVLRQPRAGGRWRKVLAGSDIGSPDRCADDLKKLPTSVYRDLFPRVNCP